MLLMLNNLLILSIPCPVTSMKISLKDEEHEWDVG